MNMTGWHLEHFHRDRWTLFVTKYAPDGAVLSDRAVCRGPHKTLWHLEARLKQTPQQKGTQP
jgi:hypothetical protein